MKIHVQDTTEVHLARLLDDGLDISLEKPALRFSAIGMWVASLGRCTFAVLDHYAMRMDLDPNTIIIELKWDYSQEPTTIKSIQMEIFWPELPEKRVKSVHRAAHKCTIHTTIKECVDVSVEVLNRERGE